MSDGPIHTGALPVQVSGDPALAQSYERQARRLLGSLLAVHGVDQRIAAGEPGGFFKKTVLMPDGTRLTAITNDGQHLVRIDTPRRQAGSEVPHERHTASGHAQHTSFEASAGGGFEPVAPPLPPLPQREIEDEDEPEREVEAPVTVFVGELVADHSHSAFRYTDSDGFDIFDFPHGSGDYANGWAFAVSGDGETVVGGFYNDDGDYGYRWTRADGVVDLGPLDGDNRQVEATAVSDDGSVIVGKGYSLAANHKVVWVWTEQTGIVTLGPILDGPNPALSPDGTLVAVITAWNAGKVYRVADGSVVDTLDAFPFGISNDGVVVGGIGNDASFLGGHILLHGTAFRYHAETGMETLGPGCAMAISTDGTTIVGHESDDAISRTVFVDGYSVDMPIAKAWYWTRDKGYVALGEDEAGEGVPFAVDRDGSTIAGRGNYHARVRVTHYVPHPPEPGDSVSVTDNDGNIIRVVPIDILPTPVPWDDSYVPAPDTTAVVYDNQVYGTVPAAEFPHQDVLFIVIGDPRDEVTPFTYSDPVKWDPKFAALPLPSPYTEGTVFGVASPLIGTSTPA